jgi:hypothetical protein
VRSDSLDGGEELATRTECCFRFDGFRLVMKSLRIQTSAFCRLGMIYAAKCKVTACKQENGNFL